MRIEIAGALAVGKSTLAAKLAARGFHVVYEDLSSNPYLELRNQDPEKYGFLAQQRFAEDKVRAIADAVAQHHALIVSDFCLAVELAYFEFYVADRPEWLARLKVLVEDGMATTGQPDAIVFLNCPAEEQLERIRVRGRGFEQGHDLAFVEAINRMVRERVEQAAADGVRVISVDSRSMPQNTDELPPAVADLVASALPAIEKSAEAA